MLSDTQAIAVTVGNVNEAPAITSNLGGATAAITVAENTTAVTQVTAVDVDAATTLSYLITGADADKFTINASGALSFITVPNFEAAPTDANGDGVYDVIVEVSDGTLTDTQAIAVTVGNVNEAPAITSNLGGATAAITVAENATTAVTQVTAADVDTPTTLTYSIVGADAALFDIDINTGVLSFKNAPNFEDKLDAGADNVYNVDVVVTDDGMLSDTQAIAVTVGNVNEAPAITSNLGGATAAITVAENATTAVTQVTAADVDTPTTLTYSIVGADAALFDIDINTGVLSFKNAPNFEDKLDAGADNVYNVDVVVTDDGMLSDTQAIAITVSDVDEASTGGVNISTYITRAGDADLTATNTIVDPDAKTGNAPYQWQSKIGSNWVDIAGATSSILANQTGITARVTSSYNDVGGLHNFTSAETVFVGISGNDSLNGTSGVDVILGLGGEDFLNGGIGDDTMLGSYGDDTYIVSDAGDVVTENVGEGFDLVIATIDHTLADNIEMLALELGNINGTGNALDNMLFGNSGDNVLNGAAGSDTMMGGSGEDMLNGGLGNDTMLGSYGDDTYIVSDAGDVVTENVGEGFDLVIANIDHTLADNVEMLALGVGNLKGTGNALNNLMFGNNDNNVLNGAGGSDTMTGGAGADTFTYNNASESGLGVLSDVITDFTNGIDKLDFSGIDAISGTAGSTFLAIQSGVATTNSAVAGQLYYYYDGANTVVEGTVDNIAGADFQVTLIGHQTFVAQDIVL
ncbi:MAG: hypothetical protein HOP06_02505 [Methylotenera sp.]|nr:hypothetical protein [Methylotenera sp.]